MDDIIRQYKDSFAEHGNSEKSVFWPKGRQKERFDALTRYITKKEEFSVLDFGCGLAHMHEYLHAFYPQCNSYSGADIVDDFINENKKNHPDSQFILIKNYQDVTKEYDYIFSSGTFSMLYTTDVEAHKKIVFDTLKHLFSKSRNFLSVNFMTDAVDFIQPGAYHQNIKELYDFAFGNLTKRLVIDQSYMPYEYTVTFFKDQTILRPENMYPHD